MTSRTPEQIPLEDRCLPPLLRRRVTLRRQITHVPAARDPGAFSDSFVGEVFGESG